MHQLTPNEIYRTTFRRVGKDKWTSPYGFTHPHRDKNEMCPYCKNEDTEVVRDDVYLQPYRVFYGDKVQSFIVVHCWCCSAVWSVYTVLEN